MTDEQQAAEVRLAYARLFNDNPRKGDAETVLADLRLLAFEHFTVIEWMKMTGSTAGYEARLHEINGKRSVFERISSFAEMAQERLIRLEKIARAVVAEE